MVTSKQAFYEYFGTNNHNKLFAFFLHTCIEHKSLIRYIISIFNLMLTHYARSLVVFLWYVRQKRRVSSPDVIPNPASPIYKKRDLSTNHGKSYVQHVAGRNVLRPHGTVNWARPFYRFIPQRVFFHVTGEMSWRGRRRSDKRELRRRRTSASLEQGRGRALELRFEVRGCRAWRC
jgi:hypothetical protein